MIEETVSVIDVRDGRITIAAGRKSACGECSQKEGCGVSAISGLFSDQSIELELDNALGATVGDTVVVGVEDAAFLRMAMRAYLLPLLVLIGSAIAFSRLFASEWLVVLLSLAAMLASFYFNRASTRKAADLHLLRIVPTTNI